MDITQLSDDQLRQMANTQSVNQQPSADITKLSDDDLRKLSGQNTGISGQDIAQHPFQSIGKTLIQPAAQSLTGKSMEQRAVEDVNSPDYLQSKTAPFDKNIPKNGENPAMGKIITGQIEDQATIPLNYVGGKLIEPVAKGIGAGVSAIGKGISNISKSAPNYVTDVVAPKAYQMYQDAVQKFTPEIRDFAANKLKIPQSAIDTIRRNGVQNVQSTVDANGGSTDPIFQKINDGIQNFRSKADDAYSAAMNAVPEDHLFKINGTYNTLENTLQKYKLIDLKGNPTDRLVNADPVYQKLNNLYQDMKSGLVPQGKTIATGSVPKTDFQYYRDSLSRLLRDNPSDRDVMSVKNALYDDADKSGFNGLKNARNLQDQAFDIEKKFSSNPLIKEGKLDNFHNLTEANKRDLSSLQSRIGVPFMDDLEKISAGKYLDKLNEYNSNTFASDLNKAKDPTWTNDIQGKYENLIGKKNAQDIFDDVRSHVKGVNLKNTAKWAGGIGVGTTIAGGVGKGIYDRIVH